MTKQHPFYLVLFIKAQATLVAGSAADFLTTSLLVYILHCPDLVGSATGNVAGAAVQFLLSRHWAFHSEKEKLLKQTEKFILMWIGNILLSTAGIYCLQHYLHVNNLLIAKLAVSITLGLTYMYLLSKHFVFTNSPAQH